MRNHLADRVSISSLCRMLGRSERGVRSAFYTVHGMSPTRWLLTERLLATRMALVADERQAVTVTDIATRYGFYELGRFSAAYRAAFGEMPSETLRAAVRSQAAA
jgi:transcriptional regulator GlxA family with amidase domain